MQDRLGKLAPEHIQAVLKEVPSQLPLLLLIFVERRIQSRTSNAEKRPQKIQTLPPRR